eukprot:317968_1
MIHTFQESCEPNADSSLANVQTTDTSRGLNERGGWTRYYTPQGVEYEYNCITGESWWVNDEQYVQGGRLDEAEWSGNTSTPQGTHETEEWVQYHTPEGVEYEYNSITGESRWVIHQQQHVHEQHPHREDEGRNSNPYSMQSTCRSSCYSFLPPQPFQAGARGSYYSPGNRAFFEPYQLLSSTQSQQHDIDYGSGGIEGGEDEKEVWFTLRRKHGNSVGGERAPLTSLLTSQLSRLSRWTMPREETRRTNNSDDDDDERPTTESLLSQLSSWALFPERTGSSEDDCEDEPGTDSSFISLLMTWVSSWEIASNCDNLRTALMPPFLSPALIKEMIPRRLLMAPKSNTEENNDGSNSSEWLSEVQNNLA